ncbi:CD3324 family protein [Brevibacillus choshinensis]|uniref:CD3324 family protein n=1 Tax=Brevibacillus choshinensis TaxID=54911 RepID=UPI002E211E59|nr:CD3324 family protein [Brevibacillus choshinensis]MED4753058.1 CD3324 family protein [Brevibacillus choshinensis]MED4781365.1 CD3324 family protein [Brevibacillus choshinensis]
MKYVNAEKMLPEELLRSIQEYTQGSYLYIPIREEDKKQWGECTESKQILRERNESIVQAYRSGSSVKTLALHYHLTEHSIRRIIRGQR